MRRKYVLGIDIGGTFTDLVLVEIEVGKVNYLKVLSTPGNLVQGIVNAIKKASVNPREIQYFIHGSTVTTNAIIERKGAKVGLITTKGFEDLLDIQRGDREKLYDLQWDKPKHLVPPYLRMGVTERVDYKGKILEFLNEKELREIVQYFKKEGVESIAVSFLFSFKNPINEEKAKEIIEKEFKGYHSISSQVVPQIREYERTSTVVVDAYIKPVESTYVDVLEKKMVEIGMDCDSAIMHSNGGVMTTLDCKERPVYTLLSGPAGGVTASSYFGKLLEESNIITLDMGGTSCDVSLILDGKPISTIEQEVKWGIPVKVPMLDIKTVGAGGGSIAWIDKGGILKVGPKSAGAYPGPVCYQKGGTEPTVTDANICLGYLNPHSLLEGEMIVDKKLAEDAIENKIAKPLRMNLIETTKGIIEIANANMANLIREITVQRGFDPRDFVLMPFGGAGALHAIALAEQFQIKKVIVPPYSGVFSALGLILGDLTYDFVHSYLSRLEMIDFNWINGKFQEMEEKGKKFLRRAGHKGKIKIHRALDMRYLGQSYEIMVPIDNTEINKNYLKIIRVNFQKEYERLYDFYFTEESCEIVNLRTSVIGETYKPTLSYEKEGRSLDLANKGVRPVLFDINNGFKECPIFEKNLIPPHVELPSPCIIESKDSTIVVNPEWFAKIDEYGAVHIECR